LFGSCLHQNRPQPIWESVVARKPDLFLFLGDNIYGDTADIFVLREKYVRLGAQPGFQALVKTCRVLATWDDHDYGVNDGGVEFRAKREAQEAFLDFFGVSEESPRRKREGVYDATVFESRWAACADHLARYALLPQPLIFVDPPEGKKKRYIAPNTAPGRDDPRRVAMALAGGAAPCSLRICGSSARAFRCFPRSIVSRNGRTSRSSRERLCRLIAETRAGGVIFVSGDRHMAEISRLPADALCGVGYALYDVTSSGLTHAGGGAPGEPNRHRVSETNFRS
jgi:alkaline phosphatase D